MNDTPRKPFGPPADQDKPNTPDKYRNDRGIGKDRDMPDTDPELNHAEPGDYERPPPP